MTKKGIVHEESPKFFKSVFVQTMIYMYFGLHPSPLSAFDLDLPSADVCTPMPINEKPPLTIVTDIINKSSTSSILFKSTYLKCQPVHTI